MAKWQQLLSPSSFYNGGQIWLVREHVVLRSLGGKTDVTEENHNMPPFASDETKVVRSANAVRHMHRMGELLESKQP